MVIKDFGFGYSKREFQWLLFTAFHNYVLDRIRALRENNQTTILTDFTSTFYSDSSNIAKELCYNDAVNMKITKAY